jgi:glucose-1-phosphate cytidylyltransferase
MKTMLLAGGKGTRLSEETLARPKPMVEIGGKPILWHIMSLYAHHGLRDFVVACGYKGEQIKEYFLNFAVHNNDYRVNLGNGVRQQLNASAVDWQVAMVDTGLDTLTGGRVKRLQPWLQEGTFMLTYGDGLSNVDLRSLLAFHHAHGKTATVTAVRPPARFGALQLEGGRVVHFSEKAQSQEGWINGGFFVFEPGVFSYLEGDQTTLEREPLERLAADGQLMAYRHEGFWQPMDTLRDKLHLEALWASGAAPWKVWG